MILSSTVLWSLSISLNYLSYSCGNCFDLEDFLALAYFAYSGHVNILANGAGSRQRLLSTFLAYIQDLLRFQPLQIVIFVELHKI